MENKIKTTICICLLAILLSVNVLAFGVASSYWKGNPVTIAPGETKTIDFRLQNTGINDETVKAEITKGTEIAKLKQEEYLVKAGTTATKVFVEIKVPSDVTLDTNYLVTISFKTVTPGNSAVSTATGTDTSFDVLVNLPENPKKEQFNFTWIIVLAIVILIIIIIITILKRRKQKVDNKLNLAETF